MGESRKHERADYCLTQFSVGHKCFSNYLKRFKLFATRLIVYNTHSLTALNENREEILREVTDKNTKTKREDERNKH